VAEAAEVRQLDHARLLVRELAEGAPHAGDLLPSRGLHVGALWSLTLVLDSLEVRPAPLLHHIAAQGVDGAVVDDAEHPGAHAPARGLVAQPAAPDRQERLLVTSSAAARLPTILYASENAAAPWRS
jgi:hypothetical protein